MGKSFRKQLNPEGDRAAGPSGRFRVLRSLVSPMSWLDVKGLQSLIKISASFSRRLHL